MPRASGEGGHLSLLRGISEKEIKRKYSRRGIFTVTQMSCTFRPRRKGKRRKQQRQLHQHALQALAIREKKIHILGTSELPASLTSTSTSRAIRNALRLSARGNRRGERDRGAAFVLGRRPRRRARIFQQFLDLLAVHEDAWLYAYGSYEATFLRRLREASGPGEARRYDSRQDVQRAVCHPPTCLLPDLLKRSEGHRRLPRLPLDGGGRLGHPEYRLAEAVGGFHSPRMKETLMTYNLEDCAALSGWPTSSTRLPRQASTPAGGSIRPVGGPRGGDGSCRAALTGASLLSPSPISTLSMSVPTSTTSGTEYSSVPAKP